MALFLMMVATLFGVQGLPIKISAVAIACWTVVWTFLGTVIGGSKARSVWRGGSMPRRRVAGTPCAQGARARECLPSSRIVVVPTRRY